MKGITAARMLSIVCLLAIGATDISEAQLYRGWRRIGPTEPGIWANIAKADGTMYIASMGGGVRKSTDFGATWTSVNNGLPPGTNSFAMDAVDPKKIFAGALSTGPLPNFPSGVYSSTDGGEHWRLSDSGNGAGLPLSMTADPVNPGTVFNGALSGVVRRTTDGGATWTTVFGTSAAPPVNSSPVGSVRVDPSDGSRVYLATLAGVYRSLNSGDPGSWAKLTGLSAPNVWGIGIGPLEPNVIYAATNDQGIWQSRDSGDTWSNVSPPLTAYNIAVDPEDPKIVYAATRTGIWWSTDHGVTWASRGLDVEGAFSVVAGPGGAVYAGTPIGAAASGDHGLNWSEIDRGLGGSGAFGYAISVDPNNRLKVFTSQLVSTITVSTDGGETWRASDRGYLSRAARSVRVDPTDSSRVYAGSFFAAGLYKSIDGGANWQRRLFGSPSVYVWATAIDPVQPNIVYAGTQGDGLWKSYDYGDTWAKLVSSANTAIPANTVQGIAIDPANNRRVFAATPSGVWRSEDGGQTWLHVQSMTKPAWNITIAGTTVYAVSKTFGVFKSVDDGDFVPTNSGITNLTMGRAAPVLVHPENPDILFAASEGGGGVYKSKDGGAHWYQVNLNLADTFVFGLAMDPERPKTLYVSCPTGVYKTITGGE